MGHGHDHASRAGARHRTPLALAFALTAAYFVVQLVVALVTDSLALLSDAGHMATDALGLGMALAAIALASRGTRDPQRTFGLYRLEILAALANAALLIAVAIYVVVEAVVRLDDAPDIAPTPVLVTASIGLAVNVVAFLLLRKGEAASMNIRGAYLEVLADMIGSIAVITGAIIIAVTDWRTVDPILGAAIGAFILPRAVRLARDAVRVLIQAAPARVDVERVRGDLASIDGVVDVHDLHVWTLTSDMEVATAHLMVALDADTHAVLDRARDLLVDRHHLHHATLQVEPEDHRGCEQVNW
jgi:cobalt-zinc-cadmium efflux system protein